MNHPSFTLVDENPHYLVVSKDHNLKTVPLKKDDRSTTLLQLVSLEYPEIRIGGHEGLILHRLDTATRGLILIARSKSAFDYFQEEQRRGRFLKTYHALTTKREGVVHGYPPLDISLEDSIVPVELRSSFCPYGRGRREVRPVTEMSKIRQKENSTNSTYTSIIRHESTNAMHQHLYKVTLSKGFRHQVRSHLSWTSFPIIGDELYGGITGNYLHLIASKIQFYDYITHEQKEFSLYQDGINPFEESLYKENKNI